MGPLGVDLGGASVTRDVLYPILIFNHLPYVIWKLPRDLDCVEARDVAIKALPLGDPALAGVGEGDDALEDLGGAALNLVLGAGEVEEFFAVGAAFVAESAVCHDDGANHAGAEIALLAWRNEVVLRHGGELRYGFGGGLSS